MVQHHHQHHQHRRHPGARTRDGRRITRRVECERRRTRPRRRPRVPPLLIRSFDPRRLLLRLETAERVSRGVVGRVRASRRSGAGRAFPARRTYARRVHARGLRPRTGPGGGGGGGGGGGAGGVGGRGGGGRGGWVAVRVEMVNDRGKGREWGAPGVRGRSRCPRPGASPLGRRSPARG